MTNLTAPAPLVEIKQLGYQVHSMSIVEEIDMAILPAEIVTIIGPNGAGKSTLLKLILGSLTPSVGKIYRLPNLKVGYMPQSFSVDPTMPVTVLRFLRMSGKHYSNDMARAALREVGAGAIERYPMHNLSGGEQQRVLLARAIMQKPDLLVLDEPMQGVDVQGQASLYQLLARLRDQYQFAILLVSHDLHLVMAATDRVICLNRHICCSGTPKFVQMDPGYHALFSQRSLEPFAIYDHHHDHKHTLDGCVEQGPHDD